MRAWTRCCRIRRYPARKKKNVSLRFRNQNLQLLYARKLPTGRYMPAKKRKRSQRQTYTMRFRQFCMRDRGGVLRKLYCISNTASSVWIWIEHYPVRVFVWHNGTALIVTSADDLRYYLQASNGLVSASSHKLSQPSLLLLTPVPFWLTFFPVLLQPSLHVREHAEDHSLMYSRIPRICYGSHHNVGSNSIHVTHSWNPEEHMAVKRHRGGYDHLEAKQSPALSGLQGPVLIGYCRPQEITNPRRPDDHHEICT